MQDCSKTARSSGFTLIELLVVIAVIAILIALLVPAVQQARESASRTNCQNNLHQIGVALLCYVDSEKAFPAGYVCRTQANSDYTSPGWGWAALILPYSEQGNVYKSMSLNLPVEDPTHLIARTTVVTMFVCPSDRSTGIFTVCDKNDKPLAQVATNSYAACNGVGPDLDDELDDSNGLFSRNSKIRFSDIPDGSSNTIAIGERASMMAQTPWAGAVSFGTTRVTPGAPGLNLDAVEEAPTQTLVHVSVHGVNDPNCDPEDFFSPHSGVANFLFADGSVRAVNTTIDLATLQALATRSGGETVDPSEY
jgi:prepilin-type N-terminal cleavage/methylation domain-containing protein/prepilin-type processing-associated H-X9-DG protein